MFTNESERAEYLDKLIAAISPSATIDSAPGLPHIWSELARVVPTPKYILEGKEYATKAEYRQAQHELSQQEALKAVMAMGQSKGSVNQDMPTPPTSKPPRKPYTRKPRE